MNPGELVFDIGANRGDYTSIFKKLQANVVALDPQKSCFRVLSRRFRNDTKVTLYPLAAANNEADFTMHVGDASEVSSMSEGWIEAVKATKRFGEAGWSRKQTVKGITLDRLISRHGAPRYIKIDVEGFEPAVISGLSQAVEFISLEWTQECPEGLEKCVQRLETLSDIELNISLGENFKLEFPEWLSWEKLKAQLEQFGYDKAYGDVYVRSRKS